MRRVLVLATVAALAVARPEMYREKEDFQYSRSSSDEGTKSGFYGAQRGNMGGNYERAHNMDLLAQHQMGGLVRTVDGELGEGSKQKSGSVYSAANSRGIYGSGHYDLSNVQGRNFQEGTSFGASQSSLSASQQAAYGAQSQSGYGAQSQSGYGAQTQSGYGAQSQSAFDSQSQTAYGAQSQSYSSAANKAYGTQSQNSRYQGYGNTEQSLQSQNVLNAQSADNIQSARQHDRTSQSSSRGYQSQSGYQGQSAYDQSAASQYDQSAASQLSSNIYGTSSTRGLQYRLVGASPVRVYIRPGSTIAIPVAAQSIDTTRAASSSYDRNSQASRSTFNQNTINSEAEALGTNQQNANKPNNDAKHYESSYSYHKEWEKHDTITSAPPTVTTINPYPSNSELNEDGQSQGYAQSETQNSRNAASSQYRGYNVKSSRHQAAQTSRAQDYSSSANTAAISSLASSNLNNQREYNYGASGNLNSANLNSQVEDFGSKPKSYQSSYSYHKSWERQGDPYVIKPSTNGHYTAADSQAIQRLTSSSSNQASNYGSQRYSSNYRQGHQGHAYDPNCDCDENGHIRVARSNNLGRERSSYQQSQNIHDGQENIGQQSQRLEDFGQQAQNLDDFGQQSQKLEDLGQQSQNLEDFGQQSQKLEDFGQQSQKLEDFGQQSQKLEDFGQQSQKLEDFGQQTQDAGQLTQSFNRLEDFGQQAQNQWDQQSQTDAGQETQNTWNMHETIQHSHGDKNTEQQSNLTEPSSNVFQINYPSLNEAGSQSQDKLNPFANTFFDDRRSDKEKTELGKQSFTSVTFVRPPGQQMQFYWQPLPSNMNQNNHNAYVPLTPFNPDRPTFPDWENYMKAHSNTEYEYNNQRNYQSVYGSSVGTYVTSKPQNEAFVLTGKPAVYSSTYRDYNSNSQYPGTSNTQISSNTWTFPSQQSHYHSTNFQHYGNENAFTNTATFVNYNNQATHSTTNITFPQINGSTNSTNLWDINDAVDKMTTMDKASENTYQENRQNVQINSNLDFIRIYQNLNTTNLNTLDNFDKIFNPIAQIPSTTELNIEMTTNKKLRPQTVERGDIEPEISKPQEQEGRGDIGPEDNNEPNFPRQPLQILGITPTKPTIEKTSEKIEPFVLKKENNKTLIVNPHSIDDEKKVNLEQDDWQFEKLFGVVSLDDHKNIEHSQQDNWKLESDLHRTTSTTPKSSNNYEHNFYNQKNQFEHLGQQQESVVNFGQQESIPNFGQQESIPNFGQQESIPNFGQQESIPSFDQQESVPNFSQQESVPNFSQQESVPNFSQQESVPNFSQQESVPNFSQQESVPNFSQQESVPNFSQQESVPNFSQQESVPNFSQQESIPNFGEQDSFKDFGQQSENMGQQLQQFDNFGQQSEDFQQESFGEFGQKNEHLGLQPHHTNTVGQQSENFQQESLGDIGQQSENLGQQLQDIDSFGQQSEVFQPEKLGHFDKQSENSGQKNESLQQESLGDFGQQSENVGQQLLQTYSLGQQSEGFQTDSFGDFGKQNENAEQQLQNFHNMEGERDGKQKNTNTQNKGQENKSLEKQSQIEDLTKPNAEQQQKAEIETFVPASPAIKEGKTSSHGEPVVEPEIVTLKAKSVDKEVRISSDSEPEIVTQKAEKAEGGFWSGVGSKIVGAKDSVVSWWYGG